MTVSNRRQFLKITGAAVGCHALTGCGGGSAEAADAAAGPVAAADAGPTAEITAAASSEAAAATAAAPAAAATLTGAFGTSVGARQFTVASPVAATAAPFCMGHAFRMGDVPGNSTLTIDGGKLQMAVKTVWNDGSAKFAVLAGTISLAAGQPAVVPLRRVAPDAAPAAALTTAALRATGIAAQVGCGTFGSVSWAGADWDAPFQTWVAGPVMSSWIYRKAVGNDAHLVAWLEVRLFSNGAVEVLPWIENGYILVPAPKNKSATYTFTLGGTQRFSGAIDLKHHQRTPLIGGAALSYWLGSDPGLTLRHDALYLQSTELVPAYDAKVAATAGVVNQLVATYQPLQAGNFTYSDDYMPSSGYQEPIGLLPQHDVLYLVAEVAQAGAAVVRNGFSAGRYPIHYRDEGTFRPLRFSKYPTLNIGDNQGFKDNGGSSTNSYTPAPTGGSGPGWDVSHSPSVGYLAYLVTGRFYFMEEVQFAATCNYLGNGDNSALRSGSKGLVQTAVQAWQTRSCAWDWRTRVQALSVTPDKDTELRAELLASVEANIEHFHTRYVAQPNNPYGWIKPGEDAYGGGIRVGAPWQQDFVTAAFGHALSLGLPLSRTGASKLAAFFQWKAKSVVSRLGPQGAFWYINGDPYTMMISPVGNPDYDTGKGPWYPTELDVYRATYANPPGWLGSTDGVLAGEIMPGDRAQWGNLMPALAYAVRYGVPGALAAYNRVTSASNYPALRDAFNVYPVWAVKPFVALPAWMVGKAANTWVEIPGTAGAGGAAVDAYCGIAFDERNNTIIIAAAGGHRDSADNRVVSLSLSSDTPTWTLRKASSTVPLQNVDHYPDGMPTSRHVYQSSHVIESLDRVFLFGARGAYGNPYDFPAVDAFNLSTNQWDRAGTWAAVPSGGGYGAVKVRATGDVYTTGFHKWSAATQTWSQPVSSRSADPVRWPIAHDSLRNQLFSLQWGDGQGFDGPRVSASRVPLQGSAQLPVSFNASAALAQFVADAPSYAGLDYDPVNDCFLFYCGQGTAAGRIYLIKPNDSNVWDMSVLPLASGSALPPVNRGNGVYNRFRYVPALRGFMLLANAADNIWFIRTS